MRWWCWTPGGWSSGARTTTCCAPPAATGSCGSWSGPPSRAEAGRRVRPTRSPQHAAGEREVVGQVVEAVADLAVTAQRLVQPQPGRPAAALVDQRTGVRPGFVVPGDLGRPGQRRVVEADLPAVGGRDHVERQGSASDRRGEPG